MATNRIEVAGAAQFRTSLRRVEGALPAHMLSALTAGALVAENRWKELAPVKTGTYRRSIHTVGKILGHAVEVIVGTNLTEPPYPLFLEYGTSRMAARPSARPAFDQTLPQVLATAKAALERLNGKSNGG